MQQMLRRRTKKKENYCFWGQIAKINNKEKSPRKFSGLQKKNKKTSVYDLNHNVYFNKFSMKVKVFTKL